MILTGKAKNDFEVWLYENHTGYYRSAWGLLPEPSQLAIVIEWLDSIGVFINISPSIPVGYENPDCFTYSIGINTNRLKFNTRQQATEAAIKQSNEIYNSRK